MAASPEVALVCGRPIVETQSGSNPETFWDELPPPDLAATSAVAVHR